MTIEPFQEMKQSIEERIPDYDTEQFETMRDRIRKALREKESEMLLSVRSLKILILGDWNDKAKMERLVELKRLLLKNGLYAETIDSYYNPNTRGGLSQIQVFETCCIMHQLIVFIDGEGPGTLTEQNYLALNYQFQFKVLFYIEESKFDLLKANPSCYIKSFPTIITYRNTDLPDKVLSFSRLRIYRLVDIITQQSRRGRGPGNPQYSSWNVRLGKR